MAIRAVFDSILYNLRPGHVGVGSTVKAMVGPRGCGKTTALVNFVRALPQLRPDIIPIYINVAEHRDQDVGRVITREVGRIVQMSEPGMQALEPNDMYLYGARAAAIQNGRRIMIALDDVQAVWQANTEGMKATYALLWHLGNTGDGSVGTIMCGSVASLHRLINNVDVDHTRFIPRRSLNGTKFPLISISPENISSTIRPEFGHDFAKLVHWACGGSLRRAAAINEFIDWIIHHHRTRLAPDMAVHWNCHPMLGIYRALAASGSLSIHDAVNSVNCSNAVYGLHQLEALADQDLILLMNGRVHAPSAMHLYMWKNPTANVQDVLTRAFVFL